jgi:predicted metal-dependent peptidase
MKPADDIALKLTKARVQLLFQQPFFATLCLRLTLIPAAVSTMATNGKVIYYSPAFVDALTQEELQGVLAHEVLHCALAHHCRRGVRRPRLWNVAADYAINPIVLQNGLSLPAGALIRPEYDGLSAEEIYSRLEQEGICDGQNQTPVPSGAGDGSSQLPSQSQAGAGGSGNSHSRPSQGSSPTSTAQSPQPENPAQPLGDGDDLNEPRAGGFGEVLDASDEKGKPASEAEITRQANDWAIAAEQAMRTAKSCGHEPAGVERPLNEARESRQDWRAILRDFIAATVSCDYSWSPPNRRHVASGLYLPSVRREGVGTIVIGVDTSGSIGEEELRQFAGEITAISDQAQPELIHVVYCDAAVSSTQEFGPSEPITLTPQGGGGTDFRPVFDWVENNDVQPVCLVYLTDLCCHDYPAAPPSYPVLWVTDSRRRAPFGETVKISVE